MTVIVKKNRIAKDTIMTERMIVIVIKISLLFTCYVICYVSIRVVLYRSDITLTTFRFLLSIQNNSFFVKISFS